MAIRDLLMRERLKVRLSAPVMIVSCLPLLVGVVFAWDVLRSQRNASRAITLNVRSVRAGEELAIGLRDLRSQIDRFLITGDGKFLADVPRLREELDHWVGEACQTAVTPREC